MDFWLVATVAGAGYLSKYWQSISQDNKKSSQLSSSGDPNYNRLESNGCPLRGLTNRPRQRSSVARDKTGFSEDAFDGSVLNLQSGLSGNGGLEEYDLSVEEMDCCGSNGSTRNRTSVRTKFSHARCVKPMNSLESCLMVQLYKERDETKEYVLSSLTSPATTTVRPLFVTDGQRMISKSCRNSCSAQSGTEERKFGDDARLGNDGNVHGVPSLTRIGSVESLTKAKAETGKRQKGKAIGGKDFDPLEGSPGGTALLCLGISIGIMASFMTNKRVVDKLKELLKQTENLVQDLQEEREMKDSLTVKELVNESCESQDTSDNSISKSASDIFSGEPKADSSTRHGDEDCTQKAEESSESICKIEAELEAELERLGLNMNTSNLERRSLDVDEIDPEFVVDFSQGELRVEMLRVEDVSESKSNKDGASTSATTRDTRNYAVSPRELSVRLHEVIQSRLERRVNELETVLQNSHRKIRAMESAGKNGRLRESPIAREPKPNPVPRPPLVVNLSGDALAAYDEAREELMRLSDSEEEDSPQRIYEDKEESLHGAIFGSAQNHEVPEEKSLGEIFPGSLRTPAEHISLVLGSDDTTNSRDDTSDSDDEFERELIKQIVERTKKGSSVVVNAQRLLFSMEDNERL